nr:MAG TPA: hypothetical protein [Caudoviricetes sp.]
MQRLFFASLIIYFCTIFIQKVFLLNRFCYP